MSSNSKLCFGKKGRSREILIRIPRGLMREREVVSFVKYILKFFNVNVQFVLSERGYEVKDVGEIDISRKYYYIRITLASWSRE